HIRDGCQGSRANCPLVYAIKEAIPTAAVVQVHARHATWWDIAGGDNCVRVHLPPNAQRFVRDFDRAQASEAHSFEPFSFELTTGNRMNATAT
ncbi:MAG: hypothetical protein ACREQ5_30535, partial [Candidatus Dormibacteria bacterium]